ncbi:MAG TPA: esterase-like activity of phytase family protein, partial [Thermoanaerobaculia bacterium]
MRERDRRRFGELAFRSGMVLECDEPSFGGFSGLWRSPDGLDLVGLTDNAQWLTARVETDDEGRLSGLADAVMAPLLAPDGEPLRRTRYYDTEGLTIAGGTAYVASERTQTVMRFDWARAGIKARGQLVPLPADRARAN